MNLWRWNLLWQMQINMIYFQMMEVTQTEEMMQSRQDLPVPEDAIKYQKRKISSLKLDIQESDIKISQLEKKANKKLISAKLSGTVTYVGDGGSGETTDGKALLKVKSSDGFM